MLSSSSLLLDALLGTLSTSQYLERENVLTESSKGEDDKSLGFDDGTCMDLYVAALANETNVKLACLR